MMSSKTAKSRRELLRFKFIAKVNENINIKIKK